ncbi:MAG: hypothetical protein OEM62_08265, partial [Acidobacteriota bacterium]|nr:hypothetical protein [Acidobacteriota bacterium]
VLDERGRQAEVPIVPMALELDQVPEPRARGTYETKLLLRQIPHDAVAAVHDPAGGRILTAGFRIVP